MTTTYTFDVFSSLDGYGSHSTTSPTCGRCSGRRQSELQHGATLDR
jgi:hypothetical protein